jgi:hypothetical protein
LEETLLLVVHGGRGGWFYRCRFSIGFTLEDLIAVQVYYGQAGDFLPGSGVVFASWNTSAKIRIHFYRWMPN